LDGFTSVSYAHLSHDDPSRLINFPTWTIPYWTRLSRLSRHAVLPWKRAEQWLATALSDVGRRELVGDARAILRELPWTGQTVSFTDAEPITSLTRYLSSNWLGTVNIDQQLDILRLRLSREMSVHEFDILPMSFVTKLLDIYQHNRDAYGSSQPFRQLWAHGEELSTPACQQMRIGGIAHVNGNHWVAFVLDLRTLSILYGDSLGLADAVVGPALSWWTEQHTQRQFTKEPLLIGTQSDSVSCGIFALCALTHHFFPDTPLVGQRLVVTDRLERFCASGHSELDAVSHNHHRFDIS